MPVVEYFEYNPTFAKALAEMWNRSSSGWNGTVFNSSEAKVLKEEEESIYLKLWLAISETQVIGYVKLTRYPEEQGVAYIHMLSVDPLWHDKGIGKALVKMCVLEAAKLGYQRLDLFTWAGNTKAVPLYKKCGFFWEKMEAQATHFMNFLPGILNNCYFKEYFNHFDWYEDQVRDLSICPDGREENGFEYYDYVWVSGDKKLSISFEKSGRGICVIDTGEISIKCEVEEAEPVFGAEYSCRYLLNNHSDKELVIKLEGLVDGNVIHKAQHQLALKDTVTLESKFSLDEPQLNAGEWVSQPGVKTLVTIGTHQFEMKTGLSTRYPLEISLLNDSTFIMPGREALLYINVKNHYKQSCHFTIEFVPEEPVQILSPHTDFSLAEEEKASIPIRFVCSRGCIYYPMLRITATREDGQSTTYEKRYSVRLSTLEGRDQKIMPQRYELINGRYVLMVMENWGRNRVYFMNGAGVTCSMPYPMLGKPFSDEFESESPYDVKVEDLGGANQLSLYYRSKSFPGLQFALVYRLYPSGMLEYFLGIISFPDDASDIFARLRMTPPMTVLSYENQGRIFNLEPDMPDMEIDSLPKEFCTGNYLHFAQDNDRISVIWDPTLKVEINGWSLVWDIDLSAMHDAGKTESMPLLMYINVFDTVYQTRNHAQGHYNFPTPVYPTLELCVNAGNPILCKDLQVELRMHQDRYLNGRFTLKINDDHVSEIKELDLSQEIRKLEWERVSPPASPILNILCTASTPVYDLPRRQTLFHPHGEVNTNTSGEFLEVDNGIIQISAATDSSLPILLSLKHQGKEYLDQAYPEYLPKSFYNPYTGGLIIALEGISVANLQKEKHNLAPVSLSDQHGNTWQGLVWETEIKAYKPLRGYLYRQYYLTLPGVPLLALVCEIRQDSGSASYERITYTGFYNPGSKLDDCRIKVPIADNRWQSLTAGRESLRIMDSYRHVIVQDIASPDMLNILNLSKSDVFIHTDQHVARMRHSFYTNRVSGSPKWTLPQFMIFSKEIIAWDSLNSLFEIRFHH